MGYKDIKKQREYQRKWMQKRRQEYMKDKTCYFCAKPATHLSPKVGYKTGATAHVFSYRKDKMLAALANYDCMCKFCFKYLQARYLRLLYAGKPGTPIKLTEGDVREIKYHLGQGSNIRSIARFFKVAHTTIMSIRDGRTWSHVSYP